MKVINTNMKSASIAVSVEMFNILKEEAGYTAQIPRRFASVQSKPLPYFIFEELPLHRFISELKEKQMSQSRPDMTKVIEFNTILSLIEKEKPVLIFCSMTA